MYGKSMLTHPLNQVRAPDPLVPPRLHMEFQNCSSGLPLPLPPAYSCPSLSRRGSSAAHHFSAKLAWQRCLTSASARVLSSCQSSAEPSITTQGKPHMVVHLKEKKLFVTSITVICRAIFSFWLVSVNAGASSWATPSTRLRSICLEKQSGLPSTTDAQLFLAPKQNSSHLTSSSFFPSWATHFARSSSACLPTCTAVACRIMSQRCWGRTDSG
mmetsp:Transcript_90957/g.257600  ORF Transcript_90957/g.257600 Transcript_90957/m.257600 type:complete len:214 (-) Transcript_90957:430-1071(-)